MPASPPFRFERESRLPASEAVVSIAREAGNDESAGKRRSGRTRKASKWLRGTLIEAARAAARTRETYLAAQYHRVRARRGANKASLAIAHSLLVAV